MSDQMFETMMSSSDVKSDENEKSKPLGMRHIFHNKIKPLTLAKSLSYFRVLWKDLTYTVSQKSFGRNDKIILNAVSGYFDSQQIMAIMGPSGCGKSSLVSCISGQKKKNVSGSITISTDIEVKFAFIVQENYTLDRISIRESLMYASLLKNSSDTDHKAVVDSVLQKLMIDGCADIWPSKCSGGELKRVMIGLELVSKPNILILDEPTSGLDFVTARQLINTLIALTKQPEPLAIVLTIHQPSAKIFNLFHTIYLLSHDGQCIYNGAPKTMLLFFTEYGIHCPQFTNPADFALDVAAKEYGAAKLLTLATVVKIKTIDWPEYDFQINSKHVYRTGRHIWYLTLRSLNQIFRDPLNVTIRLSAYISMGVFICIVYGLNSGQFGGCRYEVTSVIEEPNVDLYERLTEIQMDVFENIACISMMTLLGWFLGIFPVLLLFPLETNVFLKEYGNGCYSCFSYFMSKVLSDIPFTLILPNMTAFIVYYGTGQYSYDWWRSVQFTLVFVLVTMNSSALGLLIGAILSEHPNAIAFTGMLTLVPISLLSGIMVRLYKIPLYLQWLSYGNYIRFALNAILIDIYGMGRCGQNDHKVDILAMLTEDQLFSIYTEPKINSKALLQIFEWFTAEDIEAKESVLITELHLDSADYWYDIGMLVVHLVIFRALTYIALMYKIRTNV